MHYLLTIATLLLTALCGVVCLIYITGVVQLRNAKYKRQTWLSTWLYLFLGLVIYFVNHINHWERNGVNLLLQSALLLILVNYIYDALIRINHRSTNWKKFSPSIKGLISVVLVCLPFGMIFSSSDVIVTTQGHDLITTGFYPIDYYYAGLNIFLILGTFVVTFNSRVIRISRTVPFLSIIVFLFSNILTMIGFFNPKLEAQNVFLIAAFLSKGLFCFLVLGRTLLVEYPDEWKTWFVDQIARFKKWLKWTLG